MRSPDRFQGSLAASLEITETLSPLQNEKRENSSCWRKLISGRKRSQGSVHRFRSPAFWTCSHSTDWTLHQVGLWGIKNWLWAQASGSLGARTIYPLLKHLGSRFPPWEPWYAPHRLYPWFLELAFQEPDFCQVQREKLSDAMKTKSYWLLWRFSGETSIQYSFDHSVITGPLSYRILCESHSKQTNKNKLHKLFSITFIFLALRSLCSGFLVYFIWSNCMYSHLKCIF